MDVVGAQQPYSEPYSEQLQSIIKEAEEFVSPILRPIGPSEAEGNSSSAVIEKLWHTLKSSLKREDIDTKSHDSVVIEYVLDLLTRADDLLVKQSLSPERNPIEYQLQPAQQKIIALLLDIVVFEGILPNISPGVGLPVEKRPLYPAPARKTKVQIIKEVDIEILRTCVRGLQALVQSGNAGLKQIVLRRCATELISGNAELAFNLKEPAEEVGFYRLLNSISTGTLLPLLTTLLHPATPPWFQKRLTGYMSRLPMDRDDGLKNVIEFIVDVKPGGNIQNKDLVHLRRLLTSLPESVTEPDEYFSVVVPQLLSFLEVPGTESSISSVAAYVLGGLAFRWKEAGEKYVLQPIFSKLIPTTTAMADSIDKMDIDDTTAIRCIVPEEDLHRALTKISMLVSFPNKNLVSMVLKPVILSLWALANFSETTKKESWKNTAVGLLQTYLKVCGTALEWDWLVENLLYDGERNWKFDHGSEGGVEIRWRPFDPSAVIPLEQVDGRIKLFTEFIKSQDGDIKSDLLLRVLQRWLEGRRTSSDEEKDPMALLKDAKILQLMFEDGAEHVVKKIPQVLQLVEQLLNHYVGILDTMDSRTAELAQPSLRNLGRISELSEAADTVGQDEIDEEALTVALNLLSTVVAGLDQLGSDEEKQRLQRLGKLLQKISNHRSSSNELSSLALNLSMVLAAEWQVSEGESGPGGQRKSLEPNDADTYAKALEYLRDPLVPVRAHGIHLLKNLIVARSSVLDIPETVNLLLSVLTENDSFVYLNCISCLSALSERHPKTVLGRLLSKYIDRERELSNDERLRIGEVLLRFVQRQAKAITGDIAKDMGSTLVYIAGRRDSARQPQREDKKQTEKAGTSKSGEEDEEEEGETADDSEETEKEEGIRIRASALSILGVLMETNIHSVPTSTISDSLDIALHVLKLEKGEETVVTRRAAVVLILNIMKGASDNLGPKYRFVFEKVDELRTVLRYVEGTDRDLLIKRNAADVLESLDALVEKLMVE